MVPQRSSGCTPITTSSTLRWPQCRAGADGLLTLPYWNAVQPPHWDPLARGATVGWHGGHTAAHFLRSMLEGVAFEAELHLSGLERATGTPITSLHAVGGGIRSAAWVQIIADVTGRDVQIETEGEMSAKGVAVLARAYLAYGGNAGIARAVQTWPVRARPSSRTRVRPRLTVGSAPCITSCTNGSGRCSHGCSNSRPGRATSSL